MIELLLRALIREEVTAVFEQRLQPALLPSQAIDERLTVKEAAALAKVSEKTVRNWLSTKALTAYHAGRQHRVDRRELEAFMLTGPKMKGQAMSPEQLAALDAAKLKRRDNGHGL